MQVTKDNAETLGYEAAEWVVTLHDSSANESDARNREQTNRQFLVWLQQSEQHVGAFLRADDAFCRGADIDPGRRIDLNELRRQHMEVGEREGLVCTMRKGSRTPRQRQLLATAASLFVVLGASLIWNVYRAAHVYSTDVGEQRVVKLRDGSTMTLNTNTRVTVDFSAAMRVIELHEGEALFEVEHDTQRPFVVLTPNAVVRAIGTQFDVYQHPGSTTVTVIEGLVRVGKKDVATTVDRKLLSSTPIGSAEAAAEERRVRGTAPFAAGEQATIGHEGIVKVAAANAPDSVAWRERLLIFRSKPLAEVAEEFNRYNVTQLRVLDTEVGERTISGTYSVDRPQILALYLAKDPSLSVSEEGNEWLIRRR